MKMFRSSKSRRNQKEKKDKEKKDVTPQSLKVGSPPEQLQASSLKFDPPDERLDLPPDFLKKQFGSDQGTDTKMALAGISSPPAISPPPTAAPPQPKAATAVVSHAKYPPQQSVGASHDSSISHQMASLTDLEEQAAKCAITRELVKKFVADIWNRGELELIPEVCHPGLRFNGSVGMDRVGHDGFGRMVSTIREALNNYHCEIHSMVVEGNKAFVRTRFTGQHTGQLLGYLPSGRQVAWMGATEFTCKDGKILKVWELGDVKSLEEQLSCGLDS